MRSLLYSLVFATSFSPGSSMSWTTGGIASEVLAQPWLSSADVESAPAAAEVDPVRPRRSTVIEQAPDGLFYLQAEVNGTPIDFVVDSGASVVVLNARDAARAGVISIGHVDVNTAGGAASMRRARIDRVVLAGQTLSSIDAAVVDRDLDVSLLGQSALSQLGSVTFRKTRLELE